jgi:hypothetical protein
LACEHAFNHQRPHEKKTSTEGNEGNEGGFVLRFLRFLLFQEIRVIHGIRGSVHLLAAGRAAFFAEIRPVLRSFSGGGNPPSFAKAAEGRQSAIVT